MYERHGVWERDSEVSCNRDLGRETDGGNTCIFINCCTKLNVAVTKVWLAMNWMAVQRDTTEFRRDKALTVARMANTNIILYIWMSMNFVDRYGSTHQKRGPFAGPGIVV